MRTQGTARRAIAVVVVALLAATFGVATAPEASATTLQTTVLPPADGKVFSSPDEPHHTPYGGDYSYDVGDTGAAYARFRNTNGSLSLSVAAIGRACLSGSFGDGGDRIVLNVLINGSKIGTITYAHLTRFPYTSGSVPVGARIGDAVTAADGVSKSSCWGGPHVHVEPRNDVKYGCYFAGQLNTFVNGGSPLGILGGEYAGAINTPCPGGAESGDTGQTGPSASTSADGANIRADATTQSAILGTVPGNTVIPLECWKRGEGVVRSTGTYSLWHHTTFGGTGGFVSDSTLNTPAFPNPGADQPATGEPACGGSSGPTAATSADGANIRADATTQSAILGTVPGNTTIALECWRRGEGVVRSTGTYSLWHHTTYGGTGGFVSDSTLNTPAFPNPGADQPAPGEPACDPPHVVTPSVAVSPASGDHSTTFAGTGSGFTPNAAVALTVYQPGGTEYPAAYTKTRAADGSGSFTWSWHWDAGDADGTYRFVFQDSTGPTAEAQLTITQPVGPTPTSTPTAPPGGALGFDAMSAPSLSTMQAWLASPYRAVGVYLPVHAAESDDRADKVQANLTPTWVQQVRGLGYSVVPIYFGKQAPLSCSSDKWWNMSADATTARQEGRTAADDADASADALGIPSTSPVVYDLEPYRAGCDAAITAFLGGWTERLHALGRVSSVYGSEASTTTLLRNAGTRPDPAPDALWAATNNGQPSTSSLGSSYSPWSGHLGNQYALDVTETWGGVTISIDRSAFDGGMLSTTPPVGGPSPTPSTSATSTPTPTPTVTPNPSPTATPTTTASPSTGSQTSTVPSLALSTAALNVGQSATLTAFGTPGDPVEIVAATPVGSTPVVVRRGVFDEVGSVSFAVAPRFNTRLLARTSAGSSQGQTLYVRPAESLRGSASGHRGSFSGGIVPGHPGVEVRLFTVSRGRLTLVGRTYTDANGRWNYSRTFAAHGPVSFISQTVSDSTSLAGQSNRVSVTFS